MKYILTCARIGKEDEEMYIIARSDNINKLKNCGYPARGYIHRIYTDNWEPIDWELIHPLKK